MSLCYADIFRFPLTVEEIVRFAPGEELTVEEARKRLASSEALAAVVDRRDSYYFLKGREENCRVRDGREPPSREKLEIAVRRMAPLQGIPFLRTALVTGALAAFNSPRDDDIDLLIITAPRRPWTTYFFLRLWRRFGHNPDFCFNMFLSEDKLHLEGNNQNFFYAREILGSIAVYDEHGAFDRFLAENPWVFDFFPSYLPDDERRGFAIRRSPAWRRRRRLLEKLLSGPAGDLFESLVRKIQFRQMVKSTPHAAGRMDASTIKLHKSDNRPPILNRYDRNVETWIARYRRAAGSEPEQVAV